MKNFSKISINFIKGAQSVFDFYPPFPKNPYFKKTDAERLYSDWERIGKDLYKAMEIVQYEHKHSKEKK